MFAFVPALAATGFAAFLTLGRIGQSGFATDVLVTLVLAAATAASGFAAWWWQTRFRRVPPLTDVAPACDFSDNLGDRQVVRKGRGSDQGITRARLARRRSMPATSPPPDKTRGLSIAQSPSCLRRSRFYSSSLIWKSRSASSSISR